MEEELKEEVADEKKGMKLYSHSRLWLFENCPEAYKIKYIDLRDATENLALSQHHLVRELLKLEIKICVRFDEISSRMVKIVPPIHHQKFIDYRINPGDIHFLTLDSSERIERMLKKSELVFRG